MITGAIIALIGLFLGVIGTIVPFIPGIPIMYVILLGYGYFEGFQVIDSYFLIVTGLITFASFFIDNLAAIMGAKKYGASKWGILASFLGGIFGIVIFGPLGILLGPLVAVVLVEILLGKDFNTSFKIGIGSLLGIAGGIFVKLFLALFMVIWFAWRVFF